MKIKFAALFIALFIVMMAVATVAAQPPHQCGLTYSFSVVYPKVDNLGIAPRPMPGSENTFNCIAARDPQFEAQRFPSSWDAQVYWFKLFGDEMGVNLEPPPRPMS